AALAEGAPAQLTGNATTPDAFSVPIGSTYTMEVSVSGGAPFTVSIPGQAAPYTAADIANLINGLPNTDLSATAVGGQIQLATDKTGSATTLRVLPGPTGLNAADLLGLSTNLVTGSQTT